MGLDSLPTELLIGIVANHLPSVLDLPRYLELRLINRQFDDIILYSLFDLDGVYSHFRNCVDKLAKKPGYVLRFWKAALKFREPIPREERLTGGYHNRRHEAYNKNHAATIHQALQSAIHQLTARTQPPKLNFPILPPSLTASPYHRLSVSQVYAYILCHAAMLLHGPQDAWYLLHYPVDGFEHGPGSSGDYFKPSQHSDLWFLYGSAYLNDLEAVRAILEPMKIRPTDPAVWRKRISSDFTEFVVPEDLTSPKATDEEQRWIRVVSSTLIIATSLGHAELVSYIMHLEPHIYRNAFRTHLDSTTSRSSMGQAIENKQEQVFAMLIDKWPLVTSTGFARTNFYNALRPALKRARGGPEQDFILRSILNKSSDWKSPCILKMMLQVAVKKDNLELGKYVLDLLANLPPRMFTFSWVRNDPRLWTLGYPKRHYPLGTAAYYGRVDFVKLILQSYEKTDEVEPAARASALHALTCFVRPLTPAHTEVLKELLKYTDGLSCEMPFIKAAYKHGEDFVTVFAKAMDLKQKASAHWIEAGLRDCPPMDQPSEATAQENTVDYTLGEVALAAAFQDLNLSTARMLITDFGLNLHTIFVRSNPPQKIIDTGELEELKTFLSTKSIDVIEIPERDLNNYVTYMRYEFRSKAFLTKEQHEFNMGSYYQRMASNNCFVF